MTVKRPFMTMSCCYQYCMSGVMNNVLYNGNHTNDINTTTSSTSLLNAAVAAIATVTSPWAGHMYSTYSGKANNPPSVVKPPLGTNNHPKHKHILSTRALETELLF